MSDFDTRKKELLQPLLFEAGAGLLDCQGFEFGVALLLFHLARLGATGLDPTKISLILENQDKRTAGQLIVLLKKHAKVSGGIETALEDALVARNILIHRVLIDNIEQVAQAETRSSLVLEIRALRTKVQKAKKLLHPFVAAFGEALDGVEQRKIEQEVRQSLS
jgi:hypothetical protein